MDRVLNTLLIAYVLLFTCFVAVIAFDLSLAISISRFLGPLREALLSTGLWTGSEYLTGRLPSEVYRALEAVTVSFGLVMATAISIRFIALYRLWLNPAAFAKDYVTTHGGRRYGLEVLKYRVALAAATVLFVPVTWNAYSGAVVVHANDAFVVWFLCLMVAFFGTMCALVILMQLSFVALDIERS